MEGAVATGAMAAAEIAADLAVSSPRIMASRHWPPSAPGDRILARAHASLRRDARRRSIG